MRVYDCAAPEVDWSDDSRSFSAGMDCSHDPVIGATGADSASPLIRSVSLQVPTTGQYTLTVEGDSMCGSTPLTTIFPMYGWFCVLSRKPDEDQPAASLTTLRPWAA